MHTTVKSLSALENRGKKLKDKVKSAGTIRKQRSADAELMSGLYFSSVCVHVCLFFLQMFNIRMLCLLSLVYCLSVCLCIPPCLSFPEDVSCVIFGVI